MPPLLVKWRADPADGNSIGDPLGQGLDLSHLLRRQAAYDLGSIWRVLPRPVAHAAASAATRKISPIADAAARASARSAAAAARRSHATSCAASSGHRRTATHSHHFSVKCLTGITLYSSRARAVALVHSASKRGSTATSSLPTAARIAAGVRSGIGSTGTAPAGMLFMTASYDNAGGNRRLTRPDVNSQALASGTWVSARVEQKSAALR